MTFYNHIENVRGIAIDLTNGKKWRGASDKAAVFDALDAARREYMRLSDDSAKLRELCAELLKMAERHDPEWLHWPEMHEELRELGIEVPS